MIETYVHRDMSTVCKPWGDLDWRTSVALRHAVHDALVPNSAVIIDLCRVPVIDAVGLSALVGCLRRARAIGATIDIRNARPQVQGRLDLVTIGKRNDTAGTIDGHDVA